MFESGMIDRWARIGDVVFNMNEVLYVDQYGESLKITFKNNDYVSVEATIDDYWKIIKGCKMEDGRE